MEKQEIEFTESGGIALSYDKNHPRVTIKEVIDSLQDYLDRGYQTLEPHTASIKYSSILSPVPVLVIKPILTRLETDEEFKARVKEQAEKHLKEQQEKNVKKLQRIQELEKELKTLKNQL